ncbi:LacI family DNA-binding transcriptional regulator [Rhizobium sp. ICMP 5592]|uniref:LacI family DNA-binding transcriptional regulator n=1 Tax=Rhizobium sp. ICMP 5592 TaxID=2292445 RepID=UPI0012961B85|nr:LacI family DNA-binding transcriptional regulator [Rhizobium sp. ICMP 5592]MQB46121.1 LacI family DNA-binding transcriptional regulator [Rhizobium sp. ICMP 5592]
MRRPTIAQLAEAAGVSLATVNRLLHGTGTVRPATVERILKTAEEVGFYGLDALREPMPANLPHHKLGFLMQQSHRPIYQMWAAAIIAAASRRADAVIEPNVIFEDNLAPEAVAFNLLKLGEDSDAVAVITADHSMISQAIDELRTKGVPVIAHVTDLSAPNRAAFVGTDNWKAGRTAAWFIAQTARNPGKVFPFIGNHRYQCQDFSDASFRSYMREHAPDFQVSDTLLTHEEPKNAYEIVRKLIEDEPDLRGIFVNGGGISGVLQAVRELPFEHQREIRIVCRDIGPETRKGLSEGLITAALCHPMERISDVLIDVMLGAIAGITKGSIVQRIVPFEIITPECV